MTRFFCSAESRARTEPLYGTAPRVRTWLLVEYPGIWRPDAVEESTLTPVVKERLQGIAKREPSHRQLFVRQTYRRSETMRCFVVRSSESSPSLSRVDVLTCDGPIDTLDHPDARKVEEPMFLVCTHGNHDKCCAKFGLPVYQAARESAGSQAWQCSHVGGDRFAGNLLCFPHGIYYGHVQPEDVPGLLDSYKRGEIDLPHYRGRCCYPKVVQIGEYFVRRETGITAIDALKFDSVVRGEESLVRFRSDSEIYEVALRASDGPAEYLTCKAERTNPIPRFELANFRTRNA